MSSLGGKLKKLRQDQSLTQHEMADKLGVSRDTVARLERKSDNVPMEYLRKYAEICQVDLSELLDVDSTFSQHEFYYFLRAHDADNFKLDFKKIFEDWYRRLSSLAERVPSSDLMAMQAYPMRQNEKQAVIEEAQSAAEFCRRAWDLGISPIDDPVSLLHNLGFFVGGFDFGNNSKLFGVSGKLGREGKPAIAVNNNSDIPVERQRFSLIHELGHWVAHSEDFSSSIPKKGYGRHKDIREVYADAFAGYFLVPEKALRNLIKVYRAKKLKGSLIQVCKRYFKVSYQTIVHRLNNIGYIDDNIKNNLLGRTIKKYGNREPNPIEEKLIFDQEIQMLAQGIDEFDMSREEILEMGYSGEEYLKAKMLTESFVF